MATPTRPCPYCGASVLQTATHCGNCGRPMPPSPKTSQPAKTIFGYQAPVKPAAADDEEDDAPTQISEPPEGMLPVSGPGSAKTIMGGVAPSSGSPPSAPKLPPPVSKPVPNPASKTVFGTPAIHRPPGDASGPAPSAPASAAPSGPAPGAPSAPPSTPAPTPPAPSGAAPSAPPPGAPPPGAPAPAGFPPPAHAAPGAPNQPGPPGFPPPAGQPPMQPGMQQPGMQQPGMQQPGMPQPGMQQPGMQQPGMPQPGFGGPGMFQQGFGAGPLPGEAFATKVAALLRDQELHKKLLLIGGAAVAVAVIAIPLLKAGDQLAFTWRTDSKFRLLVWPLLAAATFLFVALAPPNMRQTLPRWVFSAVPWAMAGLTIGIVGWGSVYNPGPSDIEVTLRFGLPILIAGLLLFKLQNASNLSRIIIGTGGVLVLIFFIDHLANRMFSFSGVPALIIIRNLVIGLVLLVATASGVLALGNQVPSLRQWDRFAGPVAALLLLVIPVDMLLVFLASIIHLKMGISAFFILLHQLVYAVGFAAVFIALTEVGLEGAKALFAPSPAPYGHPGQYPQQPYPPQQQPPGYPPQQPPMGAPHQPGPPHQPGQAPGQPPGHGGQGGPGGGWPPQGQ